MLYNTFLFLFFHSLHFPLPSLKLISKKKMMVCVSITLKLEYYKTN